MHNTTSSRSASLVATVLALALVALPSGVEAKKSKAQKLYKKGVNSAKVGSYDDAIRYFEEARARGAPPVTLFNIGKCYEAQGKFYVAVDYYNEYLTYPSAKKVAKIKKRIQELRIKPSIATFSTAPTGCEVHKEHDDKTTKKVGVTPLEITLEAGEHTFYVVKKGYKKKMVKIDAGYGMPFDLEITMTPEDGEADIMEVDPSQFQKKEEKEYKPVGPYLEIGAGAALHPYGHVSYTDVAGSGESRKVGFQAGADTSFGIGWNIAHGVNTGFAVGLRAGFRTFRFQGVDRSTLEPFDETSFFATLLAVPALQINLTRILALEASLPLGVAWLVPPGSMGEDVRLRLVDGYITGGNLVLLDVGVGVALKIMLVRGLYLTIEPARVQLLLPLSKWENDAKVLADIDVGVRLGYEF